MKSLWLKFVSFTEAPPKDLAHVSYKPASDHIEYIDKSSYDELKAELESICAENAMLKSSDHVRETFKAKEINELKEEIKDLEQQLRHYEPGASE